MSEKAKHFKELLDLEGQVAVKHSQHLIATGYLTVPLTSPMLSNEGKEDP